MGIGTPGSRTVQCCNMRRGVNIVFVSLLLTYSQVRPVFGQEHTAVTSEVVGSLFCTSPDLGERVDKLIKVIEDGYAPSSGHNTSVEINCCARGREGVLVSAVVSSYNSANVTGRRYKLEVVDGLLIAYPIEGQGPISEKWENSSNCYNCNETANFENLCLACDENCKYCSGPHNTKEDCLKCIYSTNDSSDSMYCLPECLHGYTKTEGCKDCTSGYYTIIGMEESGNSEEGLHVEEEEENIIERFELECLKNMECESGYFRDPMTLDGKGVTLCIAGQVSFCNQSSKNLYCDKCFGDLIEFAGLHLEVEGLPHDERIKVEELCNFEGIRCLSEEQVNECVEVDIRIQTEELIKETEEENRVRAEHNLYLAIFLPIVCTGIIVIFVALVIFAHRRYPHVSIHGDKRHREPPKLPSSPVNAVWKAKPTIRYR